MRGFLRPAFLSTFRDCGPHGLQSAFPDQQEKYMTCLNRPVMRALLRSLCIVALLLPLGCDDGDDPVEPTFMEIHFDFVNDRPFPPDSGDREFMEEFEFPESGITVLATATDEDEMEARVSRRGPGGLGVEGGGGTEPDGDATSGNRINNGEMLILDILDDAGNPVSVQLVEVVFSRIKQFEDHFETGFEIIADNDGAFPVEIEGTLDADSDAFVEPGSMVDPETGDVIINLEDVGVFGDMFIITNGRPFHPTANRFRVSSVTILVEE